MDEYFRELSAFYQVYMVEMQNKNKNISKFPLLYIFEEECRKTQLTIEKHYLSFIGQVDPADNFIKDCLRYIQLGNEKNYQELNKLIIYLKPPSAFYTKPSNFYTHQGFYELMYRVLHIIKPYELEKTIQSLKNNFSVNQLPIAEFLMSDQIPEAFEIAFDVSENLKSKDPQKGLIFFHTAICCLYIISRDIEKEREEGSVQRIQSGKSNKKKDDGTESMSSISEQQTYSPIKIVQTHIYPIEQASGVYLLIDLFQKSQRLLILFEIKKALYYPSTPKNDQFITTVKMSNELSLKKYTLEMFTMHFLLYEYDLALRQVDDNLTYLCHLLKQNISDTFYQVHDLLEELVIAIEKILFSKQFLNNLPAESKQWWYKYYQKFENERIEDEIKKKQQKNKPKKLQRHSSSSSESSSSSSESNTESQESNKKLDKSNSNSKNVVIEVKFIPSVQEFEHCSIKYDNKIQSHLDFLIRFYKLFSKFQLKFEDALTSQKQILQLKYQIQLQQTRLMFLLTKYSKPANKKLQFDKNGVLMANFDSIPEFEINAFNEEFQILIREYNNEFKLADLEQFYIFLTEDSFKWIFKRLQDRYERSLEQMMKTGQPLPVPEKEFLINLLSQCVQLFSTPVFPALMKLNQNLLLPEIMGYFDEIITIVKAVETSPKLCNAVLQVMSGTSKAFQMLKTPLDVQANIFLRMLKLKIPHPLKEKYAHTQLNMVMGDKFQFYNLAELYSSSIFIQETKAIMQISNQNNKLSNFLGYDLQIYVHHLKILSNYLLIDEAQLFFNSICGSTFYNPIMFGSCGLILLFAQVKLNIRHNPKHLIGQQTPSFTNKLLQMLLTLYFDVAKFKVETFQIEKVMTKWGKVSYAWLKQLRQWIECVRIQSIYESLYDYDDQTLKSLYMLHKSIKLQEIFADFTDCKITSETLEVETQQEDVLAELYDKENEIFGLHPVMFFSGICELYSLVYLLKTRNYQEFLENQYSFQLNLLKRICKQLKKNFYYQQFWKCLVLIIDVTQRVINMTELFQITLTHFQEEAQSKANFSFIHVQRSFKILKIIIEESLLRIFSDSNSIQNSDENSEKQDYRPKIKAHQLFFNIKVIFHGLEELNIENPRQGQLDLEIVMQTGKDSVIRLRVQENQITFGYSHIEKLNLVVNLLLPIITQCIEFWMAYVPKDVLDYQELILKKALQQAPNLDKNLIIQWLNSEKLQIRNSQESFIGLIESLEFWLMKTEGALMKELSLYQQGNDKPFANQFEALSKYFNEEGLNIDYGQLQTWEKKLQTSIRNQLDGYITPLKQETTKIKNFLIQIKKLPYFNK